MRKRLRVVSYAINGRGMGHLVRQLAILRRLRQVCALLDVQCETWLLTSSEADTLARREGIPALKIPSKAMLRDAGVDPTRYLAISRTWVMNTIAGLAPDLLLVDTFPGGSYGELVAALELVPHRVLVARRVREDFASHEAYEALLPLYQKVIVPDARGVGPILLREHHELLPPEEAREALGIPEGQRAVWLTLGGGGDVAAPSLLPRLVDSLRAADWHVVVAAGPLYRGKERRGPGITWIDRYAPAELLRGVDAAVSAGGYNSVHELMAAGVPTVFLPQPRIADDQSERCQRVAAAGAGRVAGSLDEVVALLEDPGNAEAARAFVPGGGALQAALSALETVLDPADLKMAASVLTPELSASLARLGNGTRMDRSPTEALRLVRLLSGGTPSEQARKRAVLLELADSGIDVPVLEEPSDPAALLQRFALSVEEHGVPPELATRLLESLSKKFPGSQGPDLLAAWLTLAPAWARFDDWMGAVSLLRAVPTQRALPIAAFADAIASWLERREDLFEAVAEFSRLEGSGSLPVRDVLANLGGPELQ